MSRNMDSGGAGRPGRRGPVVFRAPVKVERLRRRQLARAKAKVKPYDRQAYDKPQDEESNV